MKYFIIIRLNLLLPFIIFLDELNNGIKKEVMSKDTPRIWINDDSRVTSFSHSLVNIPLYCIMII